MLDQAETCLASTCLNRWQHVQLQHARTGCNMFHCNMSRFNILEQAETWLQHARTGCNMFHCNMCRFNMLEQEETCLAATWSNRLQLNDAFCYNK
jgi:hypothetical protein